MAKNPHHDLLLRGGTVLTMSSTPRAEAVLVRDGRIACVGSERDCVEAAVGEPEVIELDGATLLPGFVDAHCHPLVHGQFQTFTDCGWNSAPTIDDVVARLSARAGELPAGEPVRGQGFHQGNVEDLRYLRRDDLDKVATDRDVSVFHSSGHGAFVNSRMLDALGIGAHTPDPQGGRFARDGDGVPDGGLWDAAFDALTGPSGVKVGNHAPNVHLPDRPEALVAQLAWAQEQFLAAGVTSVVDAQVTSRELSTYLRLRREGGLRFRVDMLVLSSLLDQIEGLGLAGRLGDDRLALSGVKLYADGSVTGGTAHVHEAYCCNPLDHGFLYHDIPEFNALVLKAHTLGLQTGTHAQGDAAIEITIDALEAAMHAHPRADCRHRLEHCGLPTREAVDRMARLGLRPVTQPQYIGLFGDEMLRMLGERVERLVPHGDFLAAGVPLALSSDAPVTTPEPLKAIHAAVTRRTSGGTTLDDGAQKIDVMTALRGHTLGGAASIHRERELGSIEVGKHADFAVLSADPTAVPADELRELDVLQTWIAGERVHAA
jgi:predicted amidohydrolase YtcJ